MYTRTKHRIVAHKSFKNRVFDLFCKRHRQQNPAGYLMAHLSSQHCMMRKQMVLWRKYRMKSIAWNKKAVRVREWSPHQ